MAGSEKSLRDLLIRFLNGETHDSFKTIVKDFPIDRINELPPNVPYTPWHLLEHIRINQNDILEFIKNANYQEKEWSDDYWPAKSAQADKKMW